MDGLTGASLRGWDRSRNLPCSRTGARRRIPTSQPFSRVPAGSGIGRKGNLCAIAANGQLPNPSYGRTMT